jgi:hypothetical protein
MGRRARADFLTAPQAMKLLGVTYREKLAEFTRNGWLHPIRDSSTSARTRLYRKAEVMSVADTLRKLRGEKPLAPELDDDQEHGPPPPSPAEEAFHAQALADLENERSRIMAAYEQRRKDPSR